MMNNIDNPIGLIKRIHFPKELILLGESLVKTFSLKVDLLEMAEEQAKGELLIILEGKEDKLEKMMFEEKNGLQIDGEGNGLLRLPSKRFLFSFWAYLQMDYVWPSGLDNHFIAFKPAFQELRTAYDYFLTQEGRVTQNLDRETYVATLAKQGISHAEVNGLGFPMPIETGPKGETYPMFYTYCPALDQFVYSELNKGIYPYYYLSQNLAYLKKNADLVRSYGMIPGMLSFEPRSVPEQFFDRYPMLRGARVDHPFRSFKPRYNMTTTHPAVLNHYWEMTQKIIKEVPDLGFMTLWTSDSGAGFEHTKSLYVGRNGGAYLIREWKDDETIAQLATENALGFMQTILEAGRELNPDFRVITRLEPFYGELDYMWKGFKDGIEVEGTSIVAKGWNSPYSHAAYSGSKVFNGGGLHQQDWLPEETEKIKALSAVGSQASIYFGMGPEVMFAPLMGVPYPKLVWNRLENLKKGELNQLVVYGGTFPPESVPYFINYEILRAFQFDSEGDVDEKIKALAERWTDGQGAQLLITAWEKLEEALLLFPNVSTLYNTIGFAWYRLWTRPLVPDIEAIPLEERAYYQDMMCTTPHNPNNIDLSKDVLFNIADPSHCEKAVGIMDEKVLSLVHEAIELMNKGLTAFPDVDVFYDQSIRFQAINCYLTTHRNIASWIWNVHRYIDSEDPANKVKANQEIQKMIDSEALNMLKLGKLLNEEVDFISLMDEGETPLMYGKDLTTQIKIKVELMEKYRHYEPKIDPDYMMKKACE